MKRMGFLPVLLVLGAMFIGLVPGMARAEEPYPSRPIQAIVPFPPGGVSDLVARPFAASLEKVLKQPVAIVNKTGASGNVGVQIVAVARPDGYTLLIMLSTMSVGPEVDALLNRPPAYKLEDFAPIALLSSVPAVLVVKKDAPWKNFREFVADAKRRPNQIKYSTGGIYAIMHLAAELISMAADIKLNHIPMSGGGPAVTALLGGHVEASTPGANVVTAQIKAGTLRALVSTGDQRLPFLPDVPTMKELGYDVEYYIWTGFFAPKATPPSALKVLREGSRQAVNTAEFKTAMQNMQAPITYLEGDEFQKFWEKDTKRLVEVVRRIGRVQ